MQSIDERLQMYAPYFGHWELKDPPEVLGRGNSGTVYRIWDETPEGMLDAAMKVIPIPRDQAQVDAWLKECGGSQEGLNRRIRQEMEYVRAEIQTMESLRSDSHIVCFERFEIHQRRDVPLGWDVLIRMERLVPLAVFLENIGRYPHRRDLTLVLTIWDELLSGLCLCERNHVLHLDIKPENIFYAEPSKDYFKLGDFGVSIRNEQDRIAGKGIRVGTIDYMSPEMYNFRGSDSRSDMYSLGVVIYELLNGEYLPFMDPAAPNSPAERRKASLYRLSGKESIPPIKGVESGLMDILLRCVAFEPENRYPNMQAVQAALRAYMYSSTPPQTEKKSKKPLYIGLAVVGALGLAGVLALLTRRPPSPLPGPVAAEEVAEEQPSAQQAEAAAEPETAPDAAEEQTPAQQAEVPVKPELEITRELTEDQPELTVQSNIPVTASLYHFGAGEPIDISAGSGAGEYEIDGPTALDVRAFGLGEGDAYVLAFEDGEGNLQTLETRVGPSARAALHVSLSDQQTVDGQDLPVVRGGLLKGHIQVPGDDGVALTWKRAGDDGENEGILQTAGEGGRIDFELRGEDCGIDDEGARIEVIARYSDGLGAGRADASDVLWTTDEAVSRLEVRPVMEGDTQIHIATEPEAWVLAREDGETLGEALRADGDGNCVWNAEAAFSPERPLSLLVMDRFGNQASLDIPVGEYSAQIDNLGDGVIRDDAVVVSGRARPGASVEYSLLRGDGEEEILRGAVQADGEDGSFSARIDAADAADAGGITGGYFRLGNDGDGFIATQTFDWEWGAPAGEAEESGNEEEQGAEEEALQEDVEAERQAAGASVSARVEGVMDGALEDGVALISGETDPNEELTLYVSVDGEDFAEEDGVALSADDSGAFEFPFTAVSDMDGRTVQFVIANSAGERTALPAFVWNLAVPLEVDELSEDSEAMVIHTQPGAALRVTRIASADGAKDETVLYEGSADEGGARVVSPSAGADRFRCLERYRVDAADPGDAGRPGRSVELTVAEAERAAIQARIGGAVAVEGQQVPVVSGNTLTITGTAQPGQEIVAFWHSDSVILGYAEADADGAFTVELKSNGAVGAQGETGAVGVSYRDGKAQSSSCTLDAVLWTEDDAVDALEIGAPVEGETGFTIRTEPNALVGVYRYGKLLNREGDRAGEDGVYVYDNNNPMKLGEVFTVEAQDAFGNRASERVQVKVNAFAEIALSVEPEGWINASTEALQIQGTAQPGERLVLEVGGSEYEAEAGEDGRFSWSAGIDELNDLPEEGSVVVTARYAREQGDLQPATAQLNVDRSAPELTGVDLEGLSIESTEIAGSAEAGAWVTLSINGEELRARCDDGTFTFAGLELREGDELSLYAQDAAGNRSGTLEKVIAAPENDGDAAGADDDQDFGNPYQVYSEALLAVQNGNLDKATEQFEQLAENAEFSSELEATGMPLPEDLLSYAKARQAEEAGQQLEAIGLYEGLGVLDAAERRAALEAQVYPEYYEEAEQAFRYGEYERAAALFEGLGDYSDSAARAEQAREVARTPYGFAEPAMEQAVRNALGKGAGEEITMGELAGVTELNLEDAGISSLEDLPAMPGLKKLRLSGNQISDISPLSGLDRLEYLDLGNNQISDLAPLSGLTAVTDIWLSGNQIGDLTPLSGLTALKNLNLWSNQISDLSPLSGLTGLTKLHLSDNVIEDLTPLTGLTGLQELHLKGNRISDLGPLSGLKELKTLGMYGNRIGDVAPLSELTGLSVLYLADNQISDISPLSGLKELRELYLGMNDIDDLSALSGMSNLESLSLAGMRNGIDLSQLSSLSHLKKYQGPTVRWPRDGDAVILCIWPEGAEDTDDLKDALQEAFATAGVSKTGSITAPEGKSIEYLNGCIDGTIQPGLKIDGVCLFAQEGLDYAEPLAQAVVNGVAVHVMSAGEPNAVFDEICSLYGVKGKYTVRSTVDWPMNEDAVIAAVYTEKGGASDRLMDAVELAGARAGYVKVPGRLTASKEQSVKYLEYCVDGGNGGADGIEAVYLFPYEGLDYGPVIRKANQKGVAVHVFSSEDPATVFDEICALCGNPGAENPYR